MSEVSENDNSDSVFDGILTEEMVKEAAGANDLNSVEFFKIKVDTSSQSVYNICDLLPNLKSLVLDSSNISTIRDLGSGLRNIHTLSLAFCNLADIDGIGVLNGIKKLILSNNYITDVAPLAMHENIQELDLSGNNIADISVADALSSCPQLETLSLRQNPITRAPNYHIIIASLINGLKFLDGSPVDPKASNKVTNGMIIEAAAQLRIYDEEEEDERRLEMDIMYGVDHVHSTLPLNPTTQHSSVSTDKLSSGRVTGVIPDTGSELTHGSSIVLAGSMASAVRKRRNHLANSFENESNNSGKSVPSKEESTLDVLDHALLDNSSLRTSRDNNPVRPLTAKRPVEKEEMSMIDLDSAAPVVPSREIFREGDITEALVGSASPHPSHKSFITQRALSLELNGDTGKYPPSGSRPSTSGGRLRSENSTPGKTSRPSTGFRRSYQEESSSGRSNGLRSAPRPKTASAFSPLSSPLTGQKSCEKLSFPTFDEGAMFNENGSESNLLEPSFKAPSPRQLNSSRPQSVNTEKDMIQNNTRPSSFAVPSDKGLKDLNNSSTHRKDYKDFEVEEDFDALTNSLGRSKERKESIKRIQGWEEPHLKSKNGSIVHLDIVKRKQAFSSCSSFEDNSESGEGSRESSAKGKRFLNRKVGFLDEGSDSDEDIAVNHADRHRLMSVSTVNANSLGIAEMNDDYDVSNLIKRQRNQQTLQLLKTKPNSNPNPKVEPPVETTAQKQKKPTNTTTTGSSVSSQAGLNLGFNLAGSLAAIDQWVQEQDSSDDLDSGEESDVPDRFRHMFEGGVGKICGFNKESCGGLVSNEDEGDYYGSVKSSSSRGSSRGSQILSRDAILSMCTESSRQTQKTHISEEKDYDLPDNLESVSPKPTKIVLSPMNSPSPMEIPRKQHNKEKILKELNLLDKDLTLKKKSRSSSRSRSYRNKESSLIKEGLNLDTTENQIKTKRSDSRTRSRTNSKNINPSHDDFIELEVTKNDSVVEKNENKTNSKHKTIGNSPVIGEGDVRSLMAFLNNNPPKNVSQVTLKKEETQQQSPQTSGAENKLENKLVQTSSASEDRVNSSDEKNKILGKGVSMMDEDLIELLKKPPKSTPVLKTKGSFQEFFRGISSQRMEILLNRAYVDIPTMEEREAKVKKRLNLLREVLS